MSKFSITFVHRSNLAFGYRNALFRLLVLGLLAAVALCTLLICINLNQLHEAGLVMCLGTHRMRYADTGRHTNAIRAPLRAERVSMAAVAASRS